MHLRKSGLILRRLLAAVRAEAAAEAAAGAGAAVRAAAAAAAGAAATSDYAVILSPLDFFSYASVPF